MTMEPEARAAEYNLPSAYFVWHAFSHSFHACLCRLILVFMLLLYLHFVSQGELVRLEDDEEDEEPQQQNASGHTAAATNGAAAAGSDGGGSSLLSEQVKPRAGLPPLMVNLNER